ncbi:DUF6301 family protein [Actinomadura macrotermitis]|uniref:Uncharacterized protein n=1 Tax=Actinomadura macrotermitis TaxID=2585200 RepID=A0A7K0C7W1_9ACTN|nr:DUF6301 family protein [Actinomadura macrotermitis]MQY08874.1 hypothetical protein [Actinomadura macrotermitis]
MSELITTADADLVDLATRLRELRWSWQFSDFAGLAADFGWNMVSTRENRARFDCGFGHASGIARGNAGRVQVMELPVTGFASQDDAGRDALNDTFARMTAALTAAFGAPTAKLPGTCSEIRWAGPEATLRLIAGSVRINLALATNGWLANNDEAIELERQGLL